MPVKLNIAIEEGPFFCPLNFKGHTQAPRPGFGITARCILQKSRPFIWHMNNTRIHQGDTKEQDGGINQYPVEASIRGVGPSSMLNLKTLGSLRRGHLPELKF